MAGRVVRHRTATAFALLALAVAACSQKPPEQFPPLRGPLAPLTKRSASSGADIPKRRFPADVVATSPVAPDGIPELVQKLADGFAGKRVKLKVQEGPSSNARMVMRTYEDENRNTYGVNGLGVLVSWSVGPPGPAAHGDSELSDAQLIERARAWVRRHFDDREAEWPGSVKRRVAGIGQNGTKDYEIDVELRQQVAGLPSPNFVKLGLDGDGDPWIMSRDDGPIDLVGKPRVSKERALAIAAGRMGYAKTKDVSAKLEVQRDGTGTTRYVWTLEFGDGTPRPPNVHMMGGHVWASIDAVTGDVLMLGAS